MAWVGIAFCWCALAVGLLLSWIFSEHFAEWILGGNQERDLHSATPGFVG